MAATLLRKTQRELLKQLRGRREAFRTISAEVLEPVHSVEKTKKKWRFSAALLFLPCAAAFGLGTWQLARRQRKIDLLDRKRKRLEEDPVHIQAANADGLLSLEFRKVVCEGVYDEKNSIFIGPRLKKINENSRSGFYLVTPLLPTNSNENALSVQPPVLVNRGWVPTSWRENFEKRSTESKPVEDLTMKNQTFHRVAWWKPWYKSQPLEQIPKIEEKVVTVCGAFRNSEDPNIFVPENVPEIGQWFYVNVPAMAKAAGLPENTPYIEAFKDDNTNEEFPIAKTIEDLVPMSLMPSDHLNYALTWFTLSAATTYMAVKRMQEKTPTLRFR